MKLNIFICVIGLLVSTVLSQNLGLVVHVDDPSNADEAAANIVNFFRAVPSGQVVGVFNGIAPLLFSTPGSYYVQTYEQIHNTYPSQFQVQLCNNSIIGLSIPPSFFPSFATIVPAGISAIAQLQQKGYAYVKP